MIPCWVSLKHPTRLDISAQVSHSNPAPLSQTYFALPDPATPPMFLNAEMPAVGTIKWFLFPNTPSSCPGCPIAMELEPVTQGLDLYVPPQSRI